MPKPQPPKKAKRKTFAELAAEGDYSSDQSLAGKLPKDILRDYEVHQWKHAAAILSTDFPSELNDMMEVLRGLRLPHTHILEGGGGKTKIAQWIDAQFKARGWQEKRWDTKIVVDQKSWSALPTRLTVTRTRSLWNLNGATRIRFTTATSTISGCCSIFGRSASG